MAKFIKKKIARSAPILLIFTLISMSFAGFLFNFNVVINKFSVNDGIGLDVKMFAAGANNDFATTTVTVKNAPPVFTTDAAEVPSSTSTSPVNVGDSIGFTATANDTEDNKYYLLVCASQGATPGAGGIAPHCTSGTQFCVSEETNDTSQANCTYSNVADPGSEIREWYAYVCDNHTIEPDCSPYNQGSAPGSANASSPFYINHAPILHSVSTTDDNKAPGGVFTIEALVNDYDTLGGVDEIYLNICRTAVWATSTLCASSLPCQGTSTSPNISCTYTDTAPTPHGDYTYYAYVKDWHQKAAIANGSSSDYTIINVAPTVSFAAGDFNGGDNINLNLRGVGGDKRVWATSTDVQDNNGCDDVTAATSTIYWSDVNGANDCVANSNNCYQIPVNCTISDCPVGGEIDAVATVVCYADLVYYALPTDASTPISADKWLAAITAIDNTLSGVGTTSLTVGVDVVAGIGMEIDENTIPYNTIVAGQNSGDYNATTTIINYANSPLDTNVSGTNMLRYGVGPQSIPDQQQIFDLVNFSYPAATYSLSSTTPQLVDVAIDRPTTSSDVSDEIYWGIGIPLGLLSGDYSGSSTFAAVLDASGEWHQ